MTSKGTKRPLRSLTANEKLRAIRRVHDGESKASVARDIGVPESTLRGWCKNEEKIAYLSRQSSPDTDESLDHSQIKRSKFEEPNSSTSPVDYTKSHKTEVKCKPPSNHSKVDTQKTTTSAIPSTVIPERIHNRAELARIRVELGLNAQEMFMPGVNNSSASLADLSTNFILAHWNSMYSLQQQQLMQPSKASKTSAQADSSVAVSPTASLLTTVDQEKVKQLPNEKQSVNESVWYWLKSQQQSVLNKSQTSTAVENDSNGMSPPAATIAKNPTNPQSNGLNGMTAEQHAWFWTTWYNQLAYGQQEQQSQQQALQPLPLARVPHPHQEPQVPHQSPQVPHQSPQVSHPDPQVLRQDPQVSRPKVSHPQVSNSHQQVLQPKLQVPDDKPILFQRLTKDVQESLQSPPEQEEAENLSMSKKTKTRSVLDDLLFNNNNVELDETNENVDEMTRSEAVEHAEIFLKWVRSHSNPSVTAMQLLHFRTLINNVQMDGERKNGGLQNKTKVKRK